MKKQQLVWQSRLFGLVGALTVVLVPAVATAFEDSMAERVRACTACHGEQGKAGPDGYYPRLAGKPADYLYNQLRNFSQERRHYPLMRGLLATLDDAYLREIALHFSRQSAPYPAPLPVKASTEILARGKALVTQGDAQLGLPACTRCHGKSLTGVLPQTPGLLGLPRDYLNAQLGGWRTGQRRTQEPDCMAQVANRLSTSDVHAVSQWLGSQTPPAPYVPALAGEPGPPLAKEFDCRAHAMAQMPVTAPLAEQDQVLVKRGAYLARIGNCALCHTTSSGASYAGGKPIATPFGEIYSSNLTPDVQTGLGQWTADDFWHALHNGISRDGRRLYPAFPYTSYTRVTREDSDALFTYLRTLAPVYQTSQVHALRWPYSEQWALKIWQRLFFAPVDETLPVPTSGPSQAPLWKRGEYLVNGLGHCGACHTPRNRFGGETAVLLGGARIPGQQAYAPSLRDPQEAGLSQWSAQEIVALLQAGVAPKGSTSGLMSEVVQHSTQYLTAADAQAMAEYLQSLPTQVSSPVDLRSQAPDAQAFARQGGKIYEKHCAECHGAQGQGRPGAYPALAGSRFVTAAQTVNLVQIVRTGGFTPSTAANPRPFGMPPFQLLLNDRELASVLTYIRSAWGNRASAVSEYDAGKRP